MNANELVETTAEHEAKRAHVRTMWAGVAERWAEHADAIDERSEELTRSMLTKANLGSGNRVLELACGAGGLGLAAAAPVGPEGVVVLSDAVPAMVEAAGARVAVRGFTNVRTATRDLEQIDEPDGAFDVVLCREGLKLSVRTYVRVQNLVPGTTKNQVNEFTALPWVVNVDLRLHDSCTCSIPVAGIGRAWVPPPDPGRPGTGARQ